MNLARRLGLLSLLLISEALLIFVHIREVQRSDIAQWSLAFAFIFVALAYPRLKKTIHQLSARVEGHPVSLRLLSAHAAAVILFVFLASPSIINSQVGAAALLTTAAWFAAGVLAAALAACAFLPFHFWIAGLRRTGKTWVYSVAAASASLKLSPLLWLVWDRFLLKFGIAITFGAVRFLLRPLLPDLIADPATRFIGSSRFSVELAGPCSGWEGMGLAFIFTVGWLWLARRECRFPRALLLIPAAMGVMFLLNIIRIAALILIGHAGAARIAMSGFHSQAGWIAFNAVVVGIAWAAPRLGWISLPQPGPAASKTSVPNKTLPYLLPFAVILASGMLSKAASAGFEWLYPLKFLSALAVLWVFRREYSQIMGKPGWLPAIAGSAIFAVWIAVDSAPPVASTTMGSGLASLSVPLRIAWLTSRTLAAVFTVPLAEELAFRGFLLRRLVSPQFEAVPFCRFTWPALIGSSVLFGLMHGERWREGTLAGLVYAAVMLRRGNLGAAVAAHAVTNALLAGWVLSGNRWYLW